MDPAPPSRRLLLLDADVSGPLAVGVRSILPEAELRTVHPKDDWPPLAASADLLVLATNCADLSTLRLLHHILREAPEKLAVLLVGDRGLAGAESLLSLPNVRFLPEPWTPRGLEQVLLHRSRPRGGEPGSAEMLAGVVEGLRDPLASLSGYLQLLRGESGEDQGSLIGPALESAREMDRLLEALELAARPGRPRRETLDGRGIASRLVEQAVQDGARAELAWDGPPMTLEIDLRRLNAALYVARLFLDRFGPGGPLLLRGKVEEARATLAWETPEPDSDSPQPTRPPAFLPGVLARLAEQLGAEPVFRWHREAVPVAAGLSWPRPPA
ncbi:MAG: hypothetical protein ISR76_05495 [Planctomycetes bacterium]|nr:hypothetical protein [Planctomycetota bacterium]